MTHENQDQSNTQQTPPAADPSGERRSSAGSAAASMVISACVAVAAGGLGLALVSALGEYFRLPPELAALGQGAPPGAEDQAKISAGNLILAYKNTAVWMGVIGGLLGITLGAVAGLIRKDTRGPLLAMLVAGITAAAIGGLSGFTAIAVDQFAQANTPPSELNLPEHYVIALHGVTWLVMGLGVGLGMGLTQSRPSAAGVGESVIVVALAGMLGGVLFPVLAGILLPASNAAVPVPGTEDMPGRILWVLLPSMLIGIASGRRK